MRSICGECRVLVTVKGFYDCTQDELGGKEFDYFFAEVVGSIRESVSKNNNRKRILIWIWKR